MSHRPIATHGMSPAMTFLFAVTGAVAVGNLYWAQPLLASISAAFAVSPSSAATLITVTQLGYALGVLLLAPLGDAIKRRLLIPRVMLVSSAALLVSALAPGFSLLLVSFAAIGLTTVAGQLLVPMASDVATDEQRGRVIGSISAGMLTGILLSRTISAVLGDAFGWRTIYYAAAAITAVLAVVMATRLPDEPPRQSVPYSRLLLSVADVVRRHRAVQNTLMLGASAFCVFSMFWTSIAFLLKAPPFSLSVTQIGLMGLVGLAGAVAARRAGSLHDRGLSVQVTGLAIVLMLISVGVAFSGQRSLAVIVVAMLLIDVAIQTTNVLNQTRLLSIEPAQRSRLNTAFIVGNFAGGAVGSTIAGFLWQRGGWSAVTGGAAVISIISLACWIIGRKALLAASRPSGAKR